LQIISGNREEKKGKPQTVQRRRGLKKVIGAGGTPGTKNPAGKSRILGVEKKKAVELRKKRKGKPKRGIREKCAESERLHMRYFCPGPGHD